MKKRFTSLLSFVLCTFAVLSLFAGPLAFSGCKSPTRNAYVASGVTHVSVTAGLKAWNQYLDQKDLEISAMAQTEPDKARVERERIGVQNKKLSEAYGKYQAAQLAVLTSAEEFSKIPKEDPDSPVAADRLSAAIAASSASLASVLNLLNEFGITTATK